MKAFNGRTVVRREKRVNDRVIVGGRELLLDPVFREYWNTVQMAEVVTSDLTELEHGDVVYVHHFVNSPEQRLPIKGNMSVLESNQIYCRSRNDEMEVLGNFILVEPITYGDAGLSKEEGGLILTSKSPKEKMEKVGVVGLIGASAKSYGLNIGDKVLFNKNCEYEILVDGKLYYRMELRDVITTIDDWSQLSI